MMTDEDEYTCECSDEYGPCPEHMDVLVSRDGASSRTADDLCATFIGDVACLFSDAGRDVPTGDAYTLAEDYHASIRAERGKADAIHERTGEWQYVSGWAPDSGCVIRPDGSVYTWHECEMSQHLADAVITVESDLFDLDLSVTWEDGYVIYRTTGGPFYTEDEDGTEDDAPAQPSEPITTRPTWADLVSGQIVWTCEHGWHDGPMVKDGQPITEDDDDA